MRRRWGGLAVAVVMTFASADALADAGSGEDPETLLRDLQQEYSALSTQDCVTACKAYASIRRAADKICGLEPGPRCNDARAKADDAQRRVQAACPDCQVASAPKKEDEFRAKTGGGSAGADSKVAYDREESAPRKGGCASCKSAPGGTGSGDLGAVIFGAWAISRVLRKKSSRRV